MSASGSDLATDGPVCPHFGSDCWANLSTRVRIRIGHRRFFDPIYVRIGIEPLTAYSRVLSNRRLVPIGSDKVPTASRHHGRRPRFPTRNGLIYKVLPWWKKKTCQNELPRVQPVFRVYYVEVPRSCFWLNWLSLNQAIMQEVKRPPFLHLGSEKFIITSLTQPSPNVATSMHPVDIW